MFYLVSNGTIGTATIAIVAEREADIASAVETLVSGGANRDEIVVNRMSNLVPFPLEKLQDDEEDQKQVESENATCGLDDCGNGENDENDDFESPSYDTRHHDGHDFESELREKVEAILEEGGFTNHNAAIWGSAIVDRLVSDDNFEWANDEQLRNLVWQTFDVMCNETKA